MTTQATTAGSPPITKKDLIQRAIRDAGSTPQAAQSLEEAEHKADTSVTVGMLGGTLDLGGFKVRPFTLATAAMLKQYNSPLIAGVPVEQVPNMILEVLRLIVLQSSPLHEAVALAQDIDALDMAAYELGEMVPPSKTSELVECVMRELRESTETQVKPSDPDAKKGGSKGKAATRAGKV